MTGLACAKAFANEGANLVLTARRLERLKAIESELKDKHPKILIQTMQMDVQDLNAVKNVFEHLKSMPIHSDPSSTRTFQEIDILVNNAGLVIGVDAIENVPDEAIDTMINTNVKGLLHVTRCVLPIMRSRNQGHIINVSSISGEMCKNR